MFKHRKKLTHSSSESLAWLRAIHAKLKREQRQQQMDELSQLADLELEAISAEVTRIKQNLAASPSGQTD